MKVYKVKYIPDGMYYCPSRKVKVNGKYVKSNLSKKGKIYQTRPSFKWYEKIYHPDDQTGGWYPVVRKTKESDWEIEEL